MRACRLAGAFSAAAASGAGAVVQVSVQRRPLASDVAPLLIEGTTYVPLRAFCEAVSAGGAVTWDAKSRSARVVSPSVDIRVTAGSRYLTINERCFYMPKGALIVGGRMMVPVRLLAKAYGADVEWDPIAKAVSVSAPGKPLPHASAVYNGDDLYWLSRIIFAESEGEPLEGKIAVGNVVLNRVASPKYPNSVYDVIFDKNYGVQFTPASSGAIYNTPDQESVAAAKLCLEGYRTVGKSLYFFNSRKSPGAWIVSNCSYVGTIGNHSFYV
jgi:N-acetylmuramoyl-L-alanine amidase